MDKVREEPWNVCPHTRHKVSSSPDCSKRKLFSSFFIRFSSELRNSNFFLSHRVFNVLLLGTSAPARLLDLCSQRSPIFRSSWESDSFCPSSCQIADEPKHLLFGKQFAPIKNINKNENTVSWIWCISANNDGNEMIFLLPFTTANWTHRRSLHWLGLVLSHWRAARRPMEPTCHPVISLASLWQLRHRNSWLMAPLAAAHLVDSGTSSRPEDRVSLQPQTQKALI